MISTGAKRSKVKNLRLAITSRRFTPLCVLMPGSRSGMDRERLALSLAGFRLSATRHVTDSVLRRNCIEGELEPLCRFMLGFM